MITPRVSSPESGSVQISKSRILENRTARLDTNRCRQYFGASVAEEANDARRELER